MPETRVQFGVLSGICASLGSLFGKLMSKTENINDNAGQVSVYCVVMELDIYILFTN